MIIDNSKYYDIDVHCSTCGKIYRPSQDAEIKEKLNVPPLIANIFCSRVCKEKYDEFLESNCASVNELTITNIQMGRVQVL